MGALRKRGTIWWIRYCRNGKRYDESSRSSKKTDAITLLKLREGDGAKGVPVTPKVGRLTFDEAVADVVNDYTLNAKRSLGDVQRKYQLHLQPYFGERRMANITTTGIRAYTVHRQSQGASNAQINRELAIVKRAFRLAMNAQTLMAMPHIELLKENNIRQGFFEREEFEAVRAAMPTALQGLMTFAYITGWRIQSEILPLQWSQIDRNTHTVRLEPGDTKNSEGRTLPYGDNPDLVEAIDEQWRSHESLGKAGEICPWVFQRHGKPIRDFRKAWKQACAKAGVVGRIPHDLRRTAVRNLVRQGVPENTAMKVTGHKTRSVFDRYDIVSESDVRSALARVADGTNGTKVGQSRRSGRFARFPQKQNRKIS